MGLLRPAVALLFIIAVPVALITTNVRIAVNEPRLYDYAIDHYDAPQTTGIERAELVRASGELRDYFRNDQELVAIQVDQGGQPAPLFNERETQHLRDVKDLFQTVFRIQEAAIVFALAYVVGVFLWAREGTIRTLATQLLLSAALTLVVVGGLGLVALAGFDSAWSRFHEVAFSNDLWQLDPATDHLIQMFPEAFWEDVSIWVGAASLLEMGALALASGVYLLFTRRQAMPSFLAGTLRP